MANDTESIQLRIDKAARMDHPVSVKSIELVLA